MHRRGLMGHHIIGTMVALVGIGGVLGATACDAEDTERTGEVTLAAKGVPGGPPAGEEDTGNNLSTPVIWSDGVTKTLRMVGTNPEDVLFTGQSAACTDLPGETCWLQQDPLNIWQAESLDATTGETTYGDSLLPIVTFEVDEVDWGDNLEARDWNVNSIVRVETVLWQTLDVPMTGYEMSFLYGQGPSEMWGTTTSLVESAEATVYSGCARLTIQKIPSVGASLTWTPATGQWSGEGVSAPYFNAAVHEAGDGPGFYSAEINVPGRVIYGYNWSVKSTGDGAGVYRLTFSLDGSVDGGLPCGTTTLNTSLAQAVVRVPVEEAAIEPAEEPTAGGTAVVDATNNLTCIDVTILSRSGGGGTKGGPKGPR